MTLKLLNERVGRDTLKAFVVYEYEQALCEQPLPKAAYSDESSKVEVNETAKGIENEGYDDCEAGL